MQGLFKDYKKCPVCGRYLPDNADEDTVCAICREVELFAQVKDYIRNNQVNEYQLAAEFGISIKLVKKWISEGRIEYFLDENKNNKLLVFCLDCGVPLSQENRSLLCPRCQIKRETMHGYGSGVGQGKMRFNVRG